MSESIFNPKVITGISDLENEIKKNVHNIVQIIKNWQLKLKSKCPKQINQIALLLDFNDEFNESLINHIADLWLDIFNKYTPTYKSSVDSNTIIFNLNAIMIHHGLILKLVSNVDYQWKSINNVSDAILNRAEIFTDIDTQAFFDISLNGQQWMNLLKYEKTQMIIIKKYCVENNNVKDKNALFELLKKNTQREQWQLYKKLLWSQFSSLRKRGLI